ncbi:kinase-like domain-containing protein [Lipomyces kononenkoae]|uniref:Kinase-like domain-containing protein n=1 Tax=Lipomyces kononenkoae TaxID=34357 RepID=A0ACC3SUK4_LIPKO
MNQDSLSESEVVAHIEQFYSVVIQDIEQLDINVYKVVHGKSESDHAPLSWVVRVFPTTRPLIGALHDAQVLSFLESNNLTAEVTVKPTAVSSYQGHAILVTDFIYGERPPGTKETFYRLGRQLGRLTTLSMNDSGIDWPGGGWHHMCGDGNIGAELREADRLLAAVIRDGRDTIDPQNALFLDVIRSELRKLAELANLPVALVHPDMVPANAIMSQGKLIMVDWSGTGIGSRLCALGFLLWAAGRRSPKLAAVVMAGYCEYAKLEREELEGLADAIRFRPLVLSCWLVITGKRSFEDLICELSSINSSADLIAEAAARAYESHSIR